LKHSDWSQAIPEEFNALLASGTWSLVSKKQQFNIIGNKWVFRLKKNLDCFIA